MSNRTGNPNEYTVLAGIVEKLLAAEGASYFYDVDDAYLVDAAQIKHLAEMAEDKTLYLVEPGLVTVNVDTGCKRLYSGDCIVTGARRIGGPELPWSDGHEPPAQVKLKIFGDILTALDTKTIALDDGNGDTTPVFVADRNLSIREADGFAIVQSQVRFEWSEAYS